MGYKMIKKIALIFFGLVLLTTNYLLLTTHFIVQADELSDVEKKLSDLKHALEQSISATTPLESNLGKLKENLDGIKAKITVIENEVETKENQVKEGEKLLVLAEELLSQKVRVIYKNSTVMGANNPFLLLGDNLSDSIRQLGYQKKVIQNDRDTIIKVVMYMKDLEEKKKELEDEKTRLGQIKEETDKQAAFLEKEISGAKQYQVKLSGEIAQLTARQKELLAAKTETFSTSVGDVPSADDPASRPDYNPGFSPAFAAFSFGAPHRKGMSQYGALGRSKKGENFEAILRHYYGDIRIETKDMPQKIKTDQGERLFEDDYLKGIAEMPASWGDEGGFEALKAQAIAARTYALSYIGWRVGNPKADGSICTSESCQVYSSGKTNNPQAAKWHQAVSETKGKIAVSNKTGDVFSTYYASTSGGYTKGYNSAGHDAPSSWDTSCGNQGCWTGEAFEKIAQSPWFFKSWYKNRAGNSCGRSSPWLKQDEFADIVNAAIIISHDGGAASHLSQPDSCLGSVPDTWDKGRARDEASKYGGPVTSVSSVSTSYSTGGDTASVTLNTDKGSFSFSGDNFKQAFNLRAPGVVYIASTLYTIEKK